MISHRSWFRRISDRCQVDAESHGVTVSHNQTGIMVLLWAPTRINREYIEVRDMLHTYINMFVVRRRNLPEADRSGNLLTRLMEARDEETGGLLSENLLRDESITTLFAVHETTASTQTFT